MPILKGIIVATVTPFTEGGREIDYDWIPPHLRFLEERGISGVLPLGTNGEGPSVSLEERKQVIDTVLAHRGGLAVVAGTGCAALPDTIKASRYALERGADAVIIVPPFYFKNLPLSGLREYYRAVFRALPPEGKALLYNIPSVSGVEIEDGLVDALQTQFPQRLLGIKDTSGRLDKTRHYLARYPRLRIFSGSDELLGPCLDAGVAGAISGLANAFPAEAVAILDAHIRAADVTAAQAAFSQMRILTRKFAQHSATKHLLHIFARLPLTHVRPPLAELTVEEAAALETEARALLRQT
ncbi:MAG: dihydrodipicolinate synthase family protein [Chloroflexi bacterium]|nr:dihydrodipicolinate synthase family protein [Chloroflexota bacterium]